MHTDLSPHLHTEECIVLINELKDCYASVRNFHCIINQIILRFLYC